MPCSQSKAYTPYPDAADPMGSEEAHLVITAPEPHGSPARQMSPPVSRARHPEHVPKDSGSSFIQAERGKGP